MILYLICTASTTKIQSKFNILISCFSPSHSIMHSFFLHTYTVCNAFIYSSILYIHLHSFQLHTSPVHSYIHLQYTFTYIILAPYYTSAFIYSSTLYIHSILHQCIHLFIYTIQSPTFMSRCTFCTVQLIHQVLLEKKFRHFLS